MLKHYYKLLPKNLRNYLTPKIVKFILGKGYRLVGCTVITYFFVREEDIVRPSV
jgi:hypothetical protein